VYVCVSASIYMCVFKWVLGASSDQKIDAYLFIL
jgi:hypothetical protein